MPVSSWSPIAGSNAGILTGITLDGSSMNVPLLDDAFREMGAQIAAQLGKVGAKGADLPSAATTDLSTATGWYCDVTGTVTITSFGTVAAGQLFVLRFASTLTITHNASTLILPQNASVITQGGDVGIFVSLGGGAWRCINYEATGGSLPAGTIVDFAGATAPSGWLLCYGQAVSRATYAALFAAISTTWGVGNGSTTFNVPDLRGRVTAGKDDMGGSSAARLSATLASTTLGGVGGAATIVLDTSTMPSHAHTASSSTESADHSHSVVGSTGGISANHTHAYTYPTSFNQVEGGTPGPANVWAGTQSAQTGAVSGDHSHALSIVSSGRSHAHVHFITVDAAGSGTAHNNTQPTTIMNKIIKH